MSKAIAKHHEGLRLRAYPDPGTNGKPYTIGYGHTRGVKLGDTCTLEQAEAWFEQDWAEAAEVVARSVKVPLSAKQFDALTSFVFNVGPGRAGVKDGFVVLKSGKPSTMLRKLNAGDYLGAAAQFPLWNKGAGKVMDGLTKRRGEERAYFLSGTNINHEPFPIEEKPVAPFLIAAIPSLIAALPEFAKIFSKPDVAERNVEAAVKASEIIMQATGSTNIQEAVEKVEAEPEAADAANAALRTSQADVLDLVERVNDMEQANIRAAREYNTAEKPLIGRWKFWHILALTVVVSALIGMGFIIATSTDIAERTMVLQVLLLGGFAIVMQFVFGSSDGSKVKDLMREK
jgi:lysozyme